MAFHKSIRGERDDLAHGIFGTLTQYPTCLIWLPSSKFAAFATRANHRAWRLEFDPDPHAPLRKELFVYRKQDLLSLHGQFIELWEATMILRNVSSSNPEFTKASRPLARLCSLPQIQAAPDRVSNRIIILQHHSNHLLNLHGSNKKRMASTDCGCRPEVSLVLVASRAHGHSLRRPVTPCKTIFLETRFVN